MSLKYRAVGVGQNGAPAGISDFNVLVGTVRDPKAKMTAPTERAFTGTEDYFTLVPVQNMFNSQGTCISADNVIAGTATPPSKFGVNGWIYENESINYIPNTFGGNVTMVRATNGKVTVGGANNARRVMTPFKFENGVMTDLGSLGGPGGEARAVNSAGAIVGQSRIDDKTFVMNGFLWKAGKMTRLPAIKANGSAWAYGVNDSDVVVGQADSDSSRVPVKWVDGKPVALSNDFGAALDINNAGVAVGSFGSGIPSAFAHDGQKLYNLNDITEGLDGFQLMSATGINSLGCICAMGMKNGDTKAFILSPA